MPDELVTQSVELAGGELRLLQPREAAELPDEGDTEWAPVTPYWSVLWRSGVVLADALDGVELEGRRVVELGCGLAAPSLAAARAGATVLATDDAPEALELAARNAEANGLSIETERIDWTRPQQLVDRGPFDLVLAADILYERSSVGALLTLLPRLAPQVWLAAPARSAGEAFLDQARSRWSIETRERGAVRIHLLNLRT